MPIQSSRRSRVDEFDTIKGKITLRAYDHQAVQTYFIGKGMVSSEFPVPIYEPMQTYAADVVERDFMPPPDPKVHPVRWRKGQISFHIDCVVLAMNVRDGC